MTDFLQYLINSEIILKGIKIKGGWIEIDTLKDYEIYNNMIKSKTINKLKSY